MSKDYGTNNSHAAPATVYGVVDGDDDVLLVIVEVHFRRIGGGIVSVC